MGLENCGVKVVTYVVNYVINVPVKDIKIYFVLEDGSVDYFICKNVEEDTVMGNFNCIEVYIDDSDCDMEHGLVIISHT